ncbi:MAG: hypothetical protein ABIN55_13965, partial [Aeromicrobium sp.]
MQPDDIVRVTLRGLTHDADEGLEQLLAAGDDDATAAAVFLQILSCRFDDALDSADCLSGRKDRLAVAASGMARAVGAGLVGDMPDTAPDDGPYAVLTSMLELETAMSGGQIAIADAIATRIGADVTPTTIDQIWACVALVRARGFSGRFTEADELLARIETAPVLIDLPQLVLLVRGSRIFVDGHLGRTEAVEAGMAWLADSYPETVKPDYVYAGAYVLAAFGANALGKLPEAAALMLHGGGGPNLPRLQVVDRVYGFEMLVEEALARQDSATALTWSEKAETLPISTHHMA